MSFATNQRERHMDPQNLSAFQCAVHLIENYKCIIHLYKNSQIKQLLFQCGIELKKLKQVEWDVEKTQKTLFMSFQYALL